MPEATHHWRVSCQQPESGMWRSVSPHLHELSFTIDHQNVPFHFSCELLLRHVLRILCYPERSADIDVRPADEAVAENSTSEFGLFGQAILVSSRLGAYCGAAWRLLEMDGTTHADPDKASPLSHFCCALKLLIRQRIIHQVQV
jgi:hypothetical protein